MRLKSELTLRQLGEDYIIVEPEQDMVDFSKVFTLNESAAFVWSKLQSKEFTLEMVVDLLLEEYGLDRSYEEMIRADAVELIGALETNGLLYKV